MAPEWLRLPLVILATVATVIASQAVISGAYSMTRQCMQLGFLPRLTVRHTSNTEEGQIYVPQVNTALMIGVLVLVFAFKTSTIWPRRMASRSPARFSAPACWRRWCSAASSIGRARPRSRCSALVPDRGVFFAANTLKVLEGGWVPLILGWG